MSSAIAVGVAGVRALSTFVTGKLILVHFGPPEFAAQAQLLQLTAIAIPIGTGFLSLAISSSLAAGQMATLARAQRLALRAGLCAAALPLLPIMVWGAGPSSSWLFGTTGWSVALAALPVAMLAAIGVSRYCALLLGAGQGRSAAIVDAAMALVGIGIVGVAALSLQPIWLMLSPVATLMSGAIVAWYCWSKVRPSDVPSRPAQISATPSPHLRAYVLTGLTASAIAPAVMLYLRADVLQQAGTMETAAFVAAQRLAALATAPVPVYVYLFLTAFFAASSIRESSARVSHLQWRVAALLASTFAALCWALPLVTPWVFSTDLHVPRSVFALAAVGEGMRAVAAIQAQYIATRGQWRRYLVADAVYFSTLLGTFLATGSDAFGLALAYASAGAAYMVFLRSMNRTVA